MSDSVTPPLFPAFERFVEQSGILANAKGILAARLPRILGQGQTRAEGLDLRPAVIERQQELFALSLPESAAADHEVQREIAEAKRAIDAHNEQMRHPENRRRFAMQVLHRLEGVQTGNKDNQFFAGRLVLVPDKSGQNWAWSITAYYPVIAKIPADIDYVMSAYKAADRIVAKWTLPVDLLVGIHVERHLAAGRCRPSLGPVRACGGTGLGTRSVSGHRGSPKPTAIHPQRGRRSPPQRRRGRLVRGVG
jgi:hypothetical protein